MIEQSSKGKLELSIVMPAHNEEGCIRQVITEWCDTLDKVGLTIETPARIIVINDNSTDGTGEILETLAKVDKRVKVVEAERGGHGPAVLLGYKLALEANSQHVFQVDSDNEFEPGEFAALWERRNTSPFVFGCRVRRGSPLHRRAISHALKLLLRILFQVDIPDANVPYRLMNGEHLELAVTSIPGDAFVPNVYMSIIVHALRIPVVYVPISHRARTTGTVSIHGWRLLQTCSRCAWGLMAWRSKFNPISYNYWSHGYRLHHEIITENAT